MFGRKPIAKRVRDRVAEPVSRARNKPGGELEDKIPEVEHRNVGGGKVAGGIGAAVATILEDTVGLPFGATVDVVDVEPVEDGHIYTVNVNAPTENIAEARAFIDAGTGFSSYFTDTFEVVETDHIHFRFARDTYQIRIKVS